MKVFQHPVSTSLIVTDQHLATIVHNVPPVPTKQSLTEALHELQNPKNRTFHFSQELTDIIDPPPNSDPTAASGSATTSNTPATDSTTKSPPAPDNSQPD